MQAESFADSWSFRPEMRRRLSSRISPISLACSGSNPVARAWLKHLEESHPPRLDFKISGAGELPAAVSPRDFSLQRRLSRPVKNHFQCERFCLQLPTTWLFSAPLQSREELVFCRGVRWLEQPKGSPLPLQRIAPSVRWHQHAEGSTGY